MPLRIVLVVLLLAVGISQGIEQATKGQYKTPTLIGDLTKIAIGGIVSASGFTMIERLTQNRRKDKRRGKGAKK